MMFTPLTCFPSLLCGQQHPVLCGVATADVSGDLVPDLDFQENALDLVLVCYGAQFVSFTVLVNFSSISGLFNICFLSSSTSSFFGQDLMQQVLALNSLLISSPSPECWDHSLLSCLVCVLLEKDKIQDFVLGKHSTS